MFFLFPSTIAIVPMELISLIHKFNNRKWCIAVNILTILRSFSNCINHSRVLTTCNQILVHIWMKFFIFYFNQIIILGDETEFIKTLFVIQFMILFFHWSIIFQLICWFETYLLKVKKNSYVISECCIVSLFKNLLQNMLRSLTLRKQDWC